MNDLGTVELRTKRLVLRKYTIDDLVQVHENWATDKLTSRFLSWNPHENIEETKQLLTNWVSCYGQTNAYNWAVFLSDSVEYIGNISIVGRSRYEVCEVGYCYGSKYWGHGYATEALKEVCRFLLKDVKFKIVTCNYIIDNAESGRVMEKAGMKRDGVLRLRGYNKITGQLCDNIYYSILENEL